uniref:VWFA domain-containing protein n=1 Tax=Caenorhabditis japonica TaxID=281687 RepID=A0A8R1HHT4_CAEJA
MEKRLQSFRIAAMHTIHFLDDRYVGRRAIYGARVNAQKRIVIFTSHSGVDDVASTKEKLREFAQLGYAVTIVGIGVGEEVYKNTYYHKFVSVQLFELGVVAQSILDTITEEGICFLDEGWTTPKPEICTTTTTTTRAPATTITKAPSTPRPLPTQPPFPVGDYQNCSCSPQSLYIDIVFVIDTSAGMGADGLMMVQYSNLSPQNNRFQVKADISTLVGQMSLDPNSERHVQVGLIKYSNVAVTIFKPSDYNNEDEFNVDLWTDARLADVDENEDEVNLNLGLVEAARMLGSMRRGVKKAVVVYAASYE